MAAKEKDEKVFNSDVEQKCNEEMRLSKKVFKEKQNEHYDWSVVININSTKLISFK